MGKVAVYGEEKRPFMGLIGGHLWGKETFYEVNRWPFMGRKRDHLWGDRWPFMGKKAPLLVYRWPFMGLCVGDFIVSSC